MGRPGTVGIIAWLSEGRLCGKWRFGSQLNTRRTDMPEYRKKKGSDTWHWCKNCSNWPTSNYDSRYTKPTTGELDNECQSKEKNNDCDT